jgi:outer membrane protein assembly factor BamA
MLKRNSLPPLVAVLFLAAVASSPGVAQQPPAPSRWSLSKVEFVGLKALKEEEIVAASGLKLGAAVGVEELQAAARRLSDTGLFRKVGFRYRYFPDRVEVTFEVEESRAANAPCVFDNFVWFSDDEIKAAVSREVPDFDGTAPPSDLLIGKIKKALARLLQERQIPGEITYMQSEAEGRDQTEHVFRVKSDDLKVCAAQVAGAKDEMKGKLLKALQPLVNTDYSRTDTRTFVGAALIPIYRQQGYLKARFLAARARLASGECKKGVVIALEAEEGAQYLWEKAVWEGNQALAAAELDAAMAMKEGAVADSTKIEAGFRAVSRAYGRLGYLSLTLKPAPVFADEQRRVSFQMTVAEGPQYRFGQVTVTGLPEAEAKRVRDRWKMQAGEIFNSDYPDSFVERLVKDGVVRPGSGVRNVGYHVKPDRQKAVADVEVQFTS